MDDLILPGTIFGQTKVAASRRASGLVQKHWDCNACNGSLLQAILYGWITPEETNHDLEVFAYKPSRNKQAPLRYMAGLVELSIKRTAVLLCNQGLHCMDAVSRLADEFEGTCIGPADVRRVIARTVAGLGPQENLNGAQPFVLPCRGHNLGVRYRHSKKPRERTNRKDGSKCLTATSPKISLISLPSPLSFWGFTSAASTITSCSTA